MDQRVDDARRSQPKALPSTRLSIVRLGPSELAANPDLARGARLALNGAGEAGALLELWLVQVRPTAKRAGSDDAVPRDAVPPAPAHARLVPADGAIGRALELMQADLQRRWSVQSLARAVGVSRAAFARRFKAALGEAPIAYLTELRLALAAHLLMEDDAVLADVAQRVGYESEFAFSRAFKRRYALPPATYRRQLRLGSAPRCQALAA